MQTTFQMDGEWDDNLRFGTLLSDLEDTATSTEEELDIISKDDTSSEYNQHTLHALINRLNYRPKVFTCSQYGHN